MHCSCMAQGELDCLVFARSWKRSTSTPAKGLGPWKRVHSFHKKKRSSRRRQQCTKKYFTSLYFERSPRCQIILSFVIVSDISSGNTIWHLLAGQCRTSERQISADWQMHSEIRSSQLRSAVLLLASNLMLAVEVQAVPLRSGACSWSGSARWDLVLKQCPAFPTQIWSSRVKPGSAHWDLALAVEAQQCPEIRHSHSNLMLAVEVIRSSQLAGKFALRSGARAVPSISHSNLKLAGEAWQCPLRSGACGSRKSAHSLRSGAEVGGARVWGRAVPAEIWHLQLGPDSAHWDLEFGEKKRREEAEVTLIKSRGLHPAGGGKKKSKKEWLMSQWVPMVSLQRWKSLQRRKKMRQPKDQRQSCNGQKCHGNKPAPSYQERLKPWRLEKRPKDREEITLARDHK